MSATTTHTPSPALIVLFWLYVGIPLALGIWETLLKASALFH
ncbi:MFS transporter small subunit [Castellaniella denitrificans]|nr:oxalate:formate antiporter [Burkholderiales bacterium]